MTAADIWCPPLPPVSGGLSRPRIGIAGISIEASTFSPHLSDDDAFTLREGEELLSYYPFLEIGRDLREAAEWVPLHHGRALPGGPVPRGTYQRMKDRILELAKQQGPFDGFLLDLHGAMSVIGMRDAEADLTTALREVIGPTPLISCTQDLHGNVSAALVEQVDLITCYRMAPHEDWMNTKERAAHNLLLRLRAGTGRPWKAFVPIPLLLPGEKTSTRVEPAASIYGRIPELEARDGVLDAALWVGYAWADEPRCQAAVVVTGDDREAVSAGARELAQAWWDAREEFCFVGPADTLAGALNTALAEGAPRPHVISDSGDNPTAGGAGDVSWTIRELLADPRLADGDLTVIHASTFDAAAVSRCFEAGVGASVHLWVGGNVDTVAPPAEFTGEVFSLTPGDPVAGRQAVVRAGSVHVVITERRKPFHHLEDFRRLGLEPLTADIVVVKIGYLEPELFDLAAGWTLALTPGGVDQDLPRLGHRNLKPGTWPFDTSCPEPDLTPVLTRREPTC
ncbi:MAG: M81 family metallopeptidase [Propionibacteriaceae bacterium]|nr:M81 family metallopeptidase [Propionibacteriaceae bacterium]